MDTSNKINSRISRTERFMASKCNFKSKYSLKKAFFELFLDQNIQEWYSKLESSSKDKNYGLYKTGIVIEKYLINFPINIYLPMLKVHTTNHRLPVELGRWVRKPFEERKC